MGKPGFWKTNPSMEATWKSRRGCEDMSRKSVQGKWDVKTWLGLIWRRRGIIFGGRCGQGHEHRFPQNAVNFSNGCGTTSFSRRIMFNDVSKQASK